MLKVGILFGGPSREREISFAGGRTVYDNLNKTLFEPVPIFVDSLRNFVLLNWQHIYKGTIRDFYPPVAFLPDSPHRFQVYLESLGSMDEQTLNRMIATVGQKITLEELPRLIDFAFLTLHGSYGEDGVIQGILQGLGIPYSGSGILPSAIGMNKAFQKRLLSACGRPTPQFITVSRHEWQTRARQDEIFRLAQQLGGDKLVVRPANQGSSIGVSIVDKADKTLFIRAVQKGFFLYSMTKGEWQALSPDGQVACIRNLVDIREGIGLPVLSGRKTIYHPEELMEFIDRYFYEHDKPLLLEGADSESEVVIEEFIEGKEFSCIVVRNTDGRPLALPPTEIIKGGEVYDYRSKYLAGLSRKVTPINLPPEKIENIRKACEELFDFFGFHVYARIDGFIKADGTIYLNDPNTTSGMLPSSFFFHQAAEIGLNPSQFLTYIILTSLEERIRSGAGNIRIVRLREQLSNELILMRSGAKRKRKVAVLLGGISTERHISVESGRNIYEKLASSDKYEPVPVFLTGTLEEHQLYKIPVNILLKDNADDIREKIITFRQHPVLDAIKRAARGITDKYAYESPLFEPIQITYEDLATEVDAVFIALHGRPGEDGRVQSKLDALHVPYNGSGVYSSRITINKFETNQILKQHGFKVAGQTLVLKDDFLRHPQKIIQQVVSKHGFPLIAKPVDEGCSSAVKKIASEEELKYYLLMAFRDASQPDKKLADALKLKPKEEFPQLQTVLVEDFITRGNAKYFMEITCGMLTHMADDGTIQYEVFEPSETLAGGEVLSLEEKFLAGEGQNITPARLGANEEEYRFITSCVKKDLERAAKILHIEGYCRIDAFVRVTKDMQVETIIIEVNSLPGMTPATCIFHQAALSGYTPYAFIDKILEFSFKKHKVEHY
ncbi:MAG: hypothetical protein KatS3mg031_0414 [Chitinophagales bacterium]|nr:MAG: hypothetical protein KatS3mg031_0414 [Chitinophagales bacterium]